MAFRVVYSNVKSVVWNSLTITGVEDISITEDAQRVAGAADDELHESIQFMGVRTTQVQLTLQTPPPTNCGIATSNAANQGKTLTFVCPGRLGSADRSYSIANVQWFNQGTNGAFGQMRKFTLTGHAIISSSTDATPVTVS